MSSGPLDNTKPGIALVPGAFHTPAHFEDFRTALEEQGFETYAPRLPTLGSTGVTCIDDAKALQKAVEKRMDEGKEFVIAAHSYGGIPGCAAVKGFTVRERAAAGKRGGFRAILFIAAFAMPEPNVDLLTAFGGKYPDWMTYETPYTGVCTIRLLTNPGKISTERITDSMSVRMPHHLFIRRQKTPSSAGSQETTRRDTSGLLRDSPRTHLKRPWIASHQIVGFHIHS